jgi:hypothetical protein
MFDEPIPASLLAPEAPVQVSHADGSNITHFIVSILCSFFVFA